MYLYYKNIFENEMSTGLVIFISCCFVCFLFCFLIVVFFWGAEYFLNYYYFNEYTRVTWLKAWYMVNLLNGRYI